MADWNAEFRRRAKQMGVSEPTRKQLDDAAYLQEQGHGPWSAASIVFAAPGSDARQALRRGGSGGFADFDKPRRR